MPDNKSINNEYSVDPNSRTRGKEVKRSIEGGGSSSSNASFSGDDLGESSQTTTRGPDLDLDVIQVYSMILEEYTSLFKKNKDIPKHRILDISSLRALLMEDDITHVELYDEMSGVINGMITGIIYNHKQRFGTDKSRLRSHIEMCMNHPRYNRAAMQRRDERRARLRKKYAQYGQQISGNKLTVLEYLDVRNASLKTACDEYQQLLAKKNAIIAEQEKKLKEQEDTIQLLRQDITKRDIDSQEKGKELTKQRDNVESLNAENARLRLERYGKKAKSSQDKESKVEKSKDDGVCINQWGLTKPKEMPEKPPAPPPNQSFFSRIFN